MSEKRGPYVNEDGGVWLPVSDYSYNEARREAAAHAQEVMGAWGRSKYLGREFVPCHEHEWDRAEDACQPEWTWAFETYEGTYKP